MAEKFGSKQISVVVPSYNEANTVGHVLSEVLKLREVGELILVDDGSTDNTTKKIGPFKDDSRFVYIRHPKNKGKGTALKTGISRAKNDVILFLDADLKNITAAKIKRIFTPVLKDEVDVSRATFTRERGRLTEYAVKPMMKILFPDMDFSQPISGQICAKKSFLEKIDLEKKYGVDIGILFDAIYEGQRIIEVDIGRLEHKANSEENIAEMARQVLETMIQKAGLIQHKYKLVIFTFDHTLIQKKTLEWIYVKLDIEKEMAKLQQKLSGDTLSYVQYSKEVAKLFKGMNVEDVEAICLEAPLVSYVPEVIGTLKRRKYQVALISTNYSPIVAPVCKKIGIEMIDCIYFDIKDGKYTGTISGPSLEKWIALDMETAFDKAFSRIISRAKVKSSETVMIANSVLWNRIIEKTGLFIAYRPDNSVLKETADKTINVLAEILALVE